MAIEADLIRKWQHGWSLARGLPEPEVGADGISVRCDQPGREVEVVALHADEDPASVTRLAAVVAASAAVTWLTVPTNRPDEVERLILDSGLKLLKRSEALMTVDLARHPVHRPADSYRAEIRSNESVIQASLYDSADEVAAYGQMGIAGTHAVADRIETLPAHRRRGLGRAVMSLLAEAALAHGAKTGLLIASEEGQHLYAALGWNRVADVLIAAAPVDPDPGAS